MITAENLKLGKKYYILWGNTYYEAKLKDKTSLYSEDQFIFSTRIGDLYLRYSALYLRYSAKNNKWLWSNPKIYETKFEAILEIGIHLFKGFHMNRAPYSQKKHITLSMAHIPEKMI